MKRVSRHFNIGIEHIYLLIGFILGFLAVLNGISLFNYYINCKNDGQEYSYKYNSIITLSSTDEDVDIERIIKMDKYNISYSDGLQVYVDKSKKFRLIDILFTNNETTEYKIIDGRMPSKKEIKSGKRVVAVGKSIKKYTYNKLGKRYIDINGYKYEVVGIISTSNSNIQDQTIVIYYNCLEQSLKKNINLSQINLLLSSNKYTINREYLDSYFKKDKITIFYNNSFAFEEYARDERVSSRLYFMLYFFAIINCIIITDFWISKKRRDILIKKAYGYDNCKIIINLSKEMSLLIMIAIIFSYCIQKVINRLLIDSGCVFEMSLKNICQILLIMVFTVIMSMIVPLVRIMKEKSITNFIK